MKLTDEEIIEALEFIKVYNNGEIPYSYGKLECAILMYKYARSKLKSHTVSAVVTTESVNECVEKK